MRREIDSNMPGKIRTEYDKPWMSKEDRERQTKDYLRETTQIQVDLGMGAGDRELPSQEQLIQHTPPQGTMKARMD